MGRVKSKLVPGDKHAGAMDEQVAKFHATRGRSGLGAGPSQYRVEGKDTGLERSGDAGTGPMTGKPFVKFATRGKSGNKGGYKL